MFCLIKLSRSFKFILIIFIFFFIIGCTNEVNIIGENELYVNEEITLKTNDNKAYNWTSSNDSIATVNNGVVKGVSIGEVTIYIFKESKQVSSFSLKVLNERKVELAGKTVLLIDEEVTLDININFDYNQIIWTSSDESIATVNNGVVKGKSTGTVVIKAEVNEVTSQIDIMVVDSLVPQSIKIDPILDEYIVGMGPYKLSAKAYPEYSNQEFKWEVAGTNATINKDTGELNILDDGYIYIICRSKLNDYIFKSIVLKAKYSDDVKITNIMFIGNSLTYVNDIPGIIRKMGLTDNRIIKTTSFTPGGNTLTDILTSHRYYITDALNKKQYDYMIIQEASAANFLNYQSFLDAAKVYKEMADSKDVELFLYQTWAYKENSIYLSNMNLTRKMMQEKIYDSYKNVSVEINADINPVGEVFYEFSLLYPDIQLYQDDNHASLAGSYLSSCVHYIKLFNESVIGNTYDVGLDNDVKLLIQTYVTNYLMK